MPAAVSLREKDALTPILK